MLFSSPSIDQKINQLIHHQIRLIDLCCLCEVIQKINLYNRIEVDSKIYMGKFSKDFIFLY